METENINTFLIIDDDDMTLMALKTLVNKNFLNSIVYSATDGNEGWDLIQRHHPSIVICDIEMPGINGMQLCKMIREHKELNDIYFVILTASHDKSQKIRALEDGADDFINKPVSSEELLARIRSASRLVGLNKQMKEEYSIINQLAEELENDITDMKTLAMNFQQARIPQSVEITEFVAKASVWIANTLGDIPGEEILDIELASHLCYTGRIFLPDNLLRTPIMQDGHVTNNLMYQVPVVARNIVSSIRRFKDSATILYHIYENFDGSGFPNKIKSWQIPVGARIIRVALDFEEIRTISKQPTKQIIDYLYRESKRLYDHKAVVLLEQYLAVTKTFSSGFNERALNLQELENGMVASRDIVTLNGLKLVSAGVVLHDDIIKKIISHSTNDPILGYVFVQNI